MERKLKNLNKEILRQAQDVGRAADALNLKVFMVGGCVRDLILKRENFDLDIVVEGEIPSLVNKLSKSWHGRSVFYTQFGTATIFLRHGRHVDFVRARKEKYPYPGALPSVEPGSIKDDLFRRDFAMNAVALCLNKNKFGDCIDYFGGIGDLRSKTVRILHDLSFCDDPTRVLRAVRFEQRLGFTIEPHTLTLLKSSIQKNFSETVKPQRYFAEFKKILEEDKPVKHLRRLVGLGGLSSIFQRVHVNGNLWKLLQRIESLRSKNIYSHYSRWWLLYCIAILENLSPQELNKVFELYQLSKDEMKAIQTARGSADFLKFLKQSLSHSQVYRILKKLPEDNVLYLRSCTENRPIHNRIDQFLEKDRFAKLAVTGNDLQDLGLKSSQKTGIILHAILNERINGKVKTKKQEVSLAKKLIIEKGT